MVAPNGEIVAWQCGRLMCGGVYPAATNGSPRRADEAEVAFKAVLCYILVMDRAAALEILRRSETALRARGVSHAALFGSVARGDSRPDSDIDIMIEIDPDKTVGVYDYVDIKEYIAALFDGPVDVINRDSLKTHIKPAATVEAIYAF